MKNLLSFFVLALVLVTGACSGGGEQSQEATAETAEPTARTIHVYGIDQMKYVVKDTTDALKTGDTFEVNGETYYQLEGFTADAGEELNIKLTTISSLPATAMSHNFVLLDAGNDPAAFASASMRAKDSDYIAPDLQDQVLHHTGLAGGGETVEVTFTAPSEAGDYDYLCSFPGHFTGGMHGVMTVNASDSEMEMEEAGS